MNMFERLFSKKTNQLPPRERDNYAGRFVAAFALLAVSAGVIIALLTPLGFVSGIALATGALLLLVLLGAVVGI